MAEAQHQSHLKVDEKFDRVHLAIVGAGWHGLTMAKTYHEACPERSLRILDSAESTGGVWAQERLYPGLKTNNAIGSYEFSDFPMTPSRYGLKLEQHIPGPMVHRYLNDAVEFFGLAPFLQLRSKVESVIRNPDGSWFITYSRTDQTGASFEGQLIADKLVIATGLTSEPYIPHFVGQDDFQGFILHSKDLKARAAELGAAKNVVVVGGNKSAWDVCYSVAQAGGQAHMVLRPSGGGPSWVWPLRLRPFNTSLAVLSSTRFFTLFDPWPFDRHWLWRRVRRFLHTWTVGRWITTSFWTVLGRFIRRQNGYSTDSNTAKLTPWYSLYWMGNSLGIHNYETSWFDLARKGNIKIHIADTVSLSKTSVVLSDETIEAVDGLVSCTGWKAEPPVKFLPAETLNALGIPGSQPLARELAWQAKKSILDDRPALKEPPNRHSVVPLSKPDQSAKSAQVGPYRIYRYVVPSNPEFIAGKNLAFLGMHLSVHAILVAQAQALWITAFFEDKIPQLASGRLRQDEVELETAMHVEYERIRHPRGAGGHGAGFPDLVFDSVPYVDLLLEDLSLPSKRKQGLFEDLFRRYTLRDYRGIVQEWKGLQRLSK